jgi:hypothetical protein
MGNQSVLCPVCQGVLPASGRESYTTLRGRLIVTNGYCAGGCAERRASMEQTQQLSRPSAPVGQSAPPVAPEVTSSDAYSMVSAVGPVRARVAG